MKSAITISLVPEARGGPFVYWDDLARGAAAAARHGFDAVELFLPAPDAISIAMLRDVLATHRLALAALGTGSGWIKHRLSLTDPDSGVRARAVEFIAAFIDVAARFGARAIIGSMQGRSGGNPSARTQALDWLADGLRVLGDRALACGLPALYEPLNRSETDLFGRAGDAAEFIERRGLRGIELLCDLHHMSKEESDIAQALRVVARHLGHVHFADSNRLAIGLGHTDMAPIAAALKDIGYQGYLSAEVLPVPDAETAARVTIASYRAYFGQAAAAAP